MTARRPAAALLITGQELLLGLVADANTRFLAHELDGLGIELRRVSVVGDGRDEIATGLRDLAGHDLVIISGGLGPTHDDRTVEAVAEVAGAELVLDEQLLETIAAITAAFARRRGTDPALNRDGDRKQALVPRGATVIPPAGTAPGLLLALGIAQVLVLPGPPRELATVWRRALELEPIAAVRARAGKLLRHTLRVYGVGEPAVARAFAAAGGDAGGTRTTICARAMEVEVTIRAEPECETALEQLVAGLRSQLGDAIYAEDERPLSEHVLELLRGRGLHLAVAESCTAGLVAARLADIPGSSDVLLGGVIAYADDVKRGLLGVPAALLSEHGAVSAEVARAMAEGARAATGAEVGISVTGVAGPGGGSERKPVGLVYLHVSAPGVERGQEQHLIGDRAQVREWATVAALQLVRTTLS
ncbi:MAG TPA: competence/damage-inducible protein A [Gaiellales bacterium]|nr:competence/damage-inducible protein A [Gaiellales bacterium]